MSRVEELAKAFSKVLLKDIGQEKMLYVIVANRDETDGGVCHSHDFCDANMSMDKAYKAVFGKSALGDDEEGSMSDEVCSLWNAAWDLAKKKEFFV